MHKVVMMDPNGQIFVGCEVEVLWAPASKQFHAATTPEVLAKRAEIQHLRKIQAENQLERSANKVVEFLSGRRHAA